MLSLSTLLMSRCRKTLLECSKFDSNETLKTVFAVKELAPFQDTLIEAHSREDRVDKLITFLVDKKTPEGDFAFAFFLKALCTYISDSDDLYRKLSQLHIDVELEYLLQEASLQAGIDDASDTYVGLGNHPEKVMEIVQCLLACTYMRDSRLREDVLNLLPIEITQNLVRSDADSDLIDILRIVQLCSRYPDGLQKLAYALYQREGDTQRWQALDHLLRRFDAKFITYTRQQQLLLIATKGTWPDKILQSAYRNSTPDGWTPVKATDTRDLLSLMLENLASMLRQSDGTIPMLVFAQSLAYYAQKQQELSVEKALTGWLNERVQELGLDGVQIATLHNKARAEHNPGVYYLLVTLEPESQHNFAVRGWLQDGEDNIIQNAGIEIVNEPIPLERVPSVLDNMLEKCGEYLSEEIDKLILEIMLPNELLSHPVDHWLIDNGMALVKLGIQHKVVVRSLERARRKKAWPLWKSKWNALQELLDGNTNIDDKNYARIFDKSQCETYESLYATLRVPSVVCLALMFASLDGAADNGHVFTATLGAGIPIAVWSRKYVDTPEILHDILASFLTPESLSKIPELVWQQRIAAAESKDEQHPGRHLTLLRDDPNRLPPTTTAIQFTMPSTRKGT